MKYHSFNISHVLPEAQWQVKGPQPCCNYFASGLVSNNAQTALHVTHHPDQVLWSLESVAAHYHLPNFELHYQNFLHAHIQDPQLLLKLHAFDRFAIWEKFCVQLLSTFCPSLILPSQVVQAKPPAQDFPLGCCDTVLISSGEDSM